VNDRNHGRVYVFMCVSCISCGVSFECAGVRRALLDLDIMMHARCMIPAIYTAHSLGHVRSFKGYSRPATDQLWQSTSENPKRSGGWQGYWAHGQVLFGLCGCSLRSYLHELVTARVLMRELWGGQCQNGLPDPLNESFVLAGQSYGCLVSPV
jgi:hypothetical protein